MKRIIFLLFLAFVCNDLKAQIYHSEICFYMRAGAPLTENTDITIISFDGETIKAGVQKKRAITAKLKESADYWDDWMQKISNWGKYDSDISTSSREVYTTSWDGPEIAYYNNPWDNGVSSNRIGTIYRAFSNDLSSYIIWRQKNNSETIEDKRHYKRIDKSELMPNENLYDFLND